MTLPDLITEIDFIMDTIIFTLSLSLFDSFSTTQQIIIFILLLTTAEPLRNSIAYLAGLSGAYIACGIGGYFAIDRLNRILGRYLLSTAGMSNSNYYQSELISGIIMTVIGIWYYRKKRYAPPGHSHNIIISKLRSMNSLSAFGIGVIISVTSFPVAVPYIAALGKYSVLHTGTPAALGNILIYNLGYALPMIVILAVYLYARSGTEDLSDALHEKARVLNVKLTTWAFAGIGVFSTADALCYFIAGHAIVKGRYF